MALTGVPKSIPLLLTLAGAIPNLAAAESEWDYTTTLYGWFPGVSTTVETPVGEVESEVDFSDILETLNFAFLGAFEARKGRLALIADLHYFDIATEAETPTGTLYSDAEIESQMVIFSAYATYAVVDKPGLRFDLGVGARYLDATIDTHLEGQGEIEDESFSSDAGWADALVVARWRRTFSDQWYGVAYADVGGFGIGDSSELTWQIAAAAGYQLNEKWSMVGGFRNLTIERETERFEATSDISGPFLGFQASF